MRIQTIDLLLRLTGLIVLMFPWMDRVRSSAHYTAFTFPLILDAWRDVSQFLALLSQDTSIYGTKNVARALRFMLSFEEHVCCCIPSSHADTTLLAIEGQSSRRARLQTRHGRPRDLQRRHS